MNNQLYPSNYPQIHYPPPPPVFDGGQVIETYAAPAIKPCCNLCDTKTGVTMRSVTKDYIPVVAYVTLVLSLLIGLIVILATRIRHKIELPFCDKCWRGSRNASRFEAFALLGFIAAIIIGPIMMLKFNNGLWFSLLGLLGLGTLIWSQIYKRKNTTKYKKVDRKQVIVTTPSGELIFSK